jgi:hypothetical protein
MERCCGVYRPRNPSATALYGLLESLYERVKGVWEEVFEARYGFWRSFVEQAVFRYLDCGIFERGFARIRCRRCAEEYLVAFSCKGRGLCPSCAAKRGAAFGAFLAEEVVEEVGHTHWIFTIPKMLRPYFMHHRQLLGRLAGAAHKTLRELMAAAAGEGAGFQIGMVAVVQTFGGLLNVHPHVHALATRGGWERSGTWLPVPYVDESAAEGLVRHKVLKLLRDAGLLNEKRIELLLAWRHTGFSVRGETHIGPTDGKGWTAEPGRIKMPIGCSSVTTAPRSPPSAWPLRSPSAGCWSPRSSPISSSPCSHSWVSSPEGSSPRAARSTRTRCTTRGVTASRPVCSPAPSSRSSSGAFTAELLAWPSSSGSSPSLTSASTW